MARGEPTSSSPPTLRSSDAPRRLRSPARTGPAFRTPPPRAGVGKLNPDFLAEPPSKRRRRTMDSQDRVYQDAQRALYNALSRSLTPARTLSAVRVALMKFEQVQSGHRYVDDFVQVCRELLERLEGGQNDVEALLVATRQMAEREAMHTEALRVRIAELDRLHKAAEEEKRLQEERRQATERAKDWRLLENWPKLLARSIPSLVGSKGFGLAVTVLLLNPCQRALCNATCFKQFAQESAWGDWFREASCGAT
eukprot:scaffold37950_cov33-Tisochrysis_lutea.AAC.1